MFDEFDGHCLIDGVLNYIGTLFLTGDHKIFKTGWDILKNPKIGKVVEDNGLVYQKQLVPKIPVFIYHGSIDQIVPIVDTKKLIKIGVMLVFPLWNLLKMLVMVTSLKLLWVPLLL